jgi:hypothetical protein
MLDDAFLNRLKDKTHYDFALWLDIILGKEESLSREDLLILLKESKERLYKAESELDDLYRRIDYMDSNYE